MRDFSDTTWIDQVSIWIGWVGNETGGFRFCCALLSGTEETICSSPKSNFQRCSTRTGCEVQSLWGQRAVTHLSIGMALLLGAVPVLNICQLQLFCFEWSHGIPRRIVWHFSWHSIWHLFWHCTCTSFYLAIWHLLWHLFCEWWACSWGPAATTLILHGLAVRVRRGTLWSCACCSGPAGTTAITSLQLRSSGKHTDPYLCCSCPARTIAITSWEHSDPGLAALLWPGPLGHSDPVLAVRVRRGGDRGPLRSRACNWGPAGNTLILACWVRRGPLRSRACRWGPVGNTVILRACCSGPAGCNHEFSAPEEKKGGGTADIKSKNPHLHLWWKTRMMKNDNSDLFLHKHAAACRH